MQDKAINFVTILQSQDNSSPQTLYVITYFGIYISMKYLMRARRLGSRACRGSAQGFLQTGVPSEAVRTTKPPALAWSASAGQRARFTTPRMVCTQKLICHKSQSKPLIYTSIRHGKKKPTLHQIYTTHNIQKSIKHHFIAFIHHFIIVFIYAFNWFIKHYNKYTPY